MVKKPIPPKVPLEKWKKLYLTANKFKKAKPWEILESSQVFGVENPANGEVGYCVIMGCLNEHFALGLYRGREGLNSLDSANQDNPNSICLGVVNLQSTQDLWMVSFEDRNMLDTPDLAVIKELGLRYRGKNQWPWFRDFRPGYFPFFLDEEGVDFLTVAMEQALTVVNLYSKFNKYEIPCPYPGDDLIEFDYLTRVPYKEGEEVVWMDEFKPPPPYKEIKFPPCNFDDLRIQKMLKKVKKGADAWELVSFYYPEPVLDQRNDRPYYPRLTIILNQGTKMILANHMGLKLENSLLDDMIEIMGQFKSIPGKIYVYDKELELFLKPLSERLKIKVERKTKLSGLCIDFLNSLIKFCNAPG